jgi:hypothetical protein
MGMKIIRGLKIPNPKGQGLKSTLCLMEVGDAVKAESKYQATYIRKLMIQLGFTVTQRKLGDDIYVWRLS